MSDLRKAAQQALEYLDAPTAQLFKDARLALRAALAQPATSTWTKKDVESAAYALGMWYLALPNEQEPVAYQWLGTSVIRKRIPKTAEAGTWRPLYAVLPQRKPLTDELIDILARSMVKGNKSVNWLCRVIEAEHGIGND